MNAALDTYLQFVEERHRVWELRQLGAPQPWTTDPTVATRKFTNVFRVLDPGSQFVFDLCHPAEDPAPRDVLFRLFLYRYTNLPATWRYLREFLDGYPTVNTPAPLLVEAIQRRRDELGQKVFSGAYVILPQPNRPGDKVQQAVDLAYRWMELHADNFLRATTQEQRFTTLRQEYGVGPFMAMQILTDWGYTPQCGEDREDEFVVAGPGAIKGAKALGLTDPLAAIHRCHALIQLGDDVPTVGGRTPSLMDVQNTLCEFSKYARGPVARTYRPLHPGAQPTPLLPDHFRQN